MRERAQGFVGGCIVCVVAVSGKKLQCAYYRLGVRVETTWPGVGQTPPYISLKTSRLTDSIQIPFPENKGSSNLNTKNLVPWTGPRGRQSKQMNICLHLKLKCSHDGSLNCQRTTVNFVITHTWTPGPTGYDRTWVEAGTGVRAEFSSVKNHLSKFGHPFSVPNPIDL